MGFHLVLMMGGTSLATSSGFPLEMIKGSHVAAALCRDITLNMISEWLWSLPIPPAVCTEFFKNHPIKYEGKLPLRCVGGSTLGYH